MHTSLRLAGALALAFAPAAAMAQPAPPPAPSAAPIPGMTSGTPGAGNPMMPGMERMEQAMSHAALTGDTDHDFVAMMMPHHAGAIDMARVELRSGKDPVLRRLARDIIAAQEKELRLMQRWQSAHPAP